MINKYRGQWPVSLELEKLDLSPIYYVESKEKKTQVKTSKKEKKEHMHM